MITFTSISAPKGAYLVCSQHSIAQPSKPVLTQALTPIVMIDENDGYTTIFETVAIVSYLVDKYDKSNTLTREPSRDRHRSADTAELLQWSVYQVSSQRPYSSDALWYVPHDLYNLLGHSPDWPLASINRIKDKRHYEGVVAAIRALDLHLVGKPWLVGGKCTYADLSFVMWNVRILRVLRDALEGWSPNIYPEFSRWHDSMLARDSVKHVMSVMGNKEVKSEGKIMAGKGAKV